MTYRVSQRVLEIEHCPRRVPYFGGWFCPIFGQEKDEFLTTTVITLFDENSLGPPPLPPKTVKLSPGTNSWAEVPGQVSYFCLE